MVDLQEAFLNVNDPYTVIPQFEGENLLKKRPGIKARWIKPGEVVKIGDFNLRHGNIYVGDFLGERFCDANDNPVINPKLINSWSASQFQFPHQPPSFAALSPRLKIEFLSWLSDGMRSNLVPAEFAMIYFYGLEYRLIVERPQDSQYLLGEIRRICDLFSFDPRIRRDFSRLLMIVDLDKRSDLGRPKYDNLMEAAGQPPPDVLMYLGRKIFSNGKIDADDALLWVKASFEVVFYMPARRCNRHFEALFKLEFNRRYPDGLSVGMSKEPLRINYRLATWRLSVPVKMPPYAAYVADIRQDARLLELLKKIVDECTEKLEPYSRYVGKKPLLETSLEAVSLLPEGLHVPQFTGEYAASIAAIKNGLSKSNFITTSCEKFLSLLRLPSVEKSVVPTKIQAQIAAFLDSQNYGFEPDRRYGNLELRSDAGICIFREERTKQSETDRILRLRVEAMVIVAQADGALNSKEANYIKKIIASANKSSIQERKRLSALCTVMVKGVFPDQSVLKAVAKESPAVWEALVKDLIELVLVDGEAKTKEISCLERLFKFRKTPVAELHHMLFRSVGRDDSLDDDLTVVAEFSPGKAGVPIKTAVDKKKTAPPVVEPENVVIDWDRLSKIKAETAEVSGILSNIFNDDFDDKMPQQKLEESAGKVDTELAFEDETPHHIVSDACGLDDVHSELLRQIMEASRLEYSDFVELTRTLGLLPDGALETLNEWGFDIFDDLVVAVSDVVEINEEYAEKMKEMFGKRG